ncbi:SDR family NAD(P)-dependent oxidoreductase [Salsipaludibacter albus]|uniref:SDR family NAD(P)-dependent oxidoreductase n=1 Tax=Salsipaludibacter albus TaxID=2849650 RepID=UPI001EE40327|nr:SDR family oxidoreductase [Salsipaludibacter albus]MBY5161009.1 SDR family oxidoreductase [Salsipaludibacter albus]
MDLDGTTVLVTGATGQVGWGVAHEAMAAGARLVLTASTTSSAQQLTAAFPDAEVVAVDLAADGADETVRAAVEHAGGRLDHVFAPIGAWWQQGPTLDQPPSELRELLGTYVVAQHRLVRATAPYLARTAGSYLLVTGAAGRRPIPDAGLLVIAVRAQWALAEVLRAELADAPFRFNEVRIRTRIERDARPGVVASRIAGEVFVGLLAGDARGELLHYPG